MPRSLDAALLAGWVRAATLALERHRAEMDRINVFPIPDGDTGTNLLLTMRSAAESLRRTGGRDGKPGDRGADPVADPPTVEEPADGGSAAAVAAALARGALLGARGNSGVILSQVLRGVAEAIAAVGAIGVAAVGAAAAGVRDRGGPSGGVVLADALARAARLATAAVSRPREGTVLSVLASAARAARTAGDRLDEVAVAAADAAAGALRATTGQLPELARAGVVDAGGMGVYLVLESLAGLVSVRATADLPEPGAGRIELGPPPVAPVRSEFEVMYLLDVTDPDGVDGLRRRLDGLGESVTLADDGGGTWSVHVHTADAGPAIEAGLEIGRPHRINVTRLADEPAVVRADRHAVLLVVPGAELAGLARDAGAAVLQRTPGQPLGVPELLAALVGTGAPHVVLLAGDPALAETAERAAEAARAAGQDVLVMPSALGAAGAGRAGRARPAPPTRRRHRGHGRGGGRHPHRVAGRGPGGGADLGRPLPARRRARGGGRGGGAHRPRSGRRGAVVGSPHAGRRR